MKNLVTAVVCGSHFGDGTPDGSVVARGVREWLRLYGPIHHMVTGGASGVDSIAHALALTLGLVASVIPALWGKYGDAAGPIRNRQILEKFDVDVVLAFPGGNGTADMIGLAEAAGIPVWVWRAEWHEPGWELRTHHGKHGVQLSLPLAV